MATAWKLVRLVRHPHPLDPLKLMKINHNQCPQPPILQEAYKPSVSMVFGGPGEAYGLQTRFDSSDTLTL